MRTLVYAVGPIVSFGVMIAPSMALDCAGARTAVDVAICSNEKLKADDARISKKYFEILKEARQSKAISADKSRHDLVLARQREWLSERDRMCGALSQSRIYTCIAESMRQRLGELYHEDSTEDKTVPSEGLMLGGEKLRLSAGAGGVKVLQHGGRTLVEAPGWTTAPFTILQHWNAKETQAILIQTERGGSSHCSTSYVIETRRPGEVAVHELGMMCVEPHSPDVNIVRDGFAMTVPATPTTPGEVTTWIAKSGTVTKNPLRFAPVSGTTMADLVRSERPESLEPLENAEFYHAVDRLPAPDRGRLMNALWEVAYSPARCGHSDDESQYGVRIDSHAVSYSGCGLNATSTADDALAVWDRTNRKFYFAIATHGGVSDDGEALLHGPAHFYPSLAGWSRIAHKNLELWKSGTWQAGDGR